MSSGTCGELYARETQMNAFTTSARSPQNTQLQSRTVFYPETVAVDRRPKRRKLFLMATPSDSRRVPLPSNTRQEER